MVPWNENNLHWCVLILDRKIKRYIFIDPQKNTSIVDSTAIKEYLKVATQKKFIKGKFEPLEIKHTMQDNKWACGYICSIVIIDMLFKILKVVYKYILGQSLTFDMNIVNDFREMLFSIYKDTFK